MNKNGIGNKIIYFLNEFVVYPTGKFSEHNGKLIITICTICICLFITRPMTNNIELPKSVEDTVGDIPIIEHWDDGKVEIIPNPYAEHTGYYPMATGMVYYTPDVIWGRGY